MNSFFVGNTLINDAYVGNIRVDELLAAPYLEVDYLVIAGGGASGRSNTNYLGGAGGAGGLITGSIVITKTNTTYTVIIGNPGTGSITLTAGQSGENNSLIGGALNVVAIGGGGGGASGPDAIIRNGRNGGSGGGAGVNGVTGSGTAGQGFNGALASSPSIGGGGGGAKSAAVGRLGGSGSIWLDGVEYGRGGESSGSTQPTIYGAGGVAYTTGNTSDGRYGTVIIRYPGTGSQLTVSGSGVQTYFSASYTYHRFWSFGGVYDATQSFTY